MSSDIYTTYVSGILGLGGDRVVDAKEDNMQLKTLISVGKYSVSKYTETSTVQLIKSLAVDVVEQLFTLLYLLYACIVLKIAHTVDNQNF